VDDVDNNPTYRVNRAPHGTLEDVDYTRKTGPSLF
jgi:hypothetical protein